MKKAQLLLLATLLAFTACKKDNYSQSSKVSTPSLGKKTDQNIPQYTTMNLQPRQPGETWDTYEATWNGVGVKVTAPYYDNVKYPTIVDGVPVTAGRMDTYGAAGAVEPENSGQDGTVFQLDVYILGGLPQTDFDFDWDTYATQLANWQSNPAVNPAPFLNQIVKSSYSQGGHTVSYTGKIIWAATPNGPTLAIADLSYPLPPATPSQIPSFPVQVFDTNYNVCYSLTGIHGTLVNGIQGTIQANGVPNFSNPINVTATGTCVDLGGGTFHWWGSVIRPDNTTFNFDVTQNLE